MNKTTLRERSKQELIKLARRRGVAGWESMTKADLVEILRHDAPKAAGKSSKSDPKSAPTKTSTNGTAKHVNGTNGSAKRTSSPAESTRPAAKPAKSKSSSTKTEKAAPPPTPRVEPMTVIDKNIASRSARAGNVVKDQLVLTVPDPYWLHAYWQLSLQSIQRAEAALGQDWHGARPVLRIYDVTSLDTTSTSEAPLRDIEIHGGCSHWYIDIPQPPRSYRVDVGYRTRAGRFFPLSRSNVVTPPKAGSTESLDENWSNELDDKVADRFLAAAAAAEAGQVPRDEDEPFRRSPKDSPFGSGAVLPGKLKKFFFEIDAQLIVVGRTDPTATVTLNNEPVKLAQDGTFAQRYSLPDSRQIIPAVATSADGMEEQTIVLAIERNTKRLDPMMHDLYGDA